MIRTPVESSCIKSIGYDDSKSVLEIEFVSRKVYQYSNVPNTVYSGILMASSKGTYFNIMIKDVYRFSEFR